jgi:hypothetical protein
LERRFRDDAGSQCPETRIEVVRCNLYDLPHAAEEPEPPCELCGRYHVETLYEVVIRNRAEAQEFRRLCRESDGIFGQDDGRPS